MAEFALIFSDQFVHSSIGPMQEFRVSKTDALDRQAVDCARKYMGDVAWTTVALGIVLVVVYVATVAGALADVLPIWFAVPMAALITYLSYTVLHDAVHGSITGNQRSLRWLNKALGYLAAWIVMIPLTAHKHEHIAHHRYANDVENDPDYHVGRMSASPLDAVGAVLRAYTRQFSYYREHCWQTAVAKQNAALCVEVFAALVPRVAIAAAGYWAEALLLFVVAWLIGAVVLLYLFAYVVHRPHARTGRYVDTSTILLPGTLNKIATWLWMFQNYHSIHHLFPRVPFYRYADLYRDIEGIMAARGAPIYRLTLRGLQPSYSSLAD